MGKSNARRKKTTKPTDPGPNPGPSPGPDPGPDPSIFIRRAHELREEGNRLFQSKEFARALTHYDLALKLLPRSHPDRAVVHSNRAACLLQSPPVDHAAVVAECSLALAAQPGFPRALLRRARSLEALGRVSEAADDVRALLAADPAHRDAVELARRLRVTPARPSPAALGASAVPVSGLGPGPALPARPPVKKPAQKANSPPPTPSPKPEPETMAAVAPEAETGRASPPLTKVTHVEHGRQGRRLKLVYGHDIRLAEMRHGCTFRALRELVSRVFPCCSSVLVKFKDGDGDLITITGTAELAVAVDSVPAGDTLRLHVVEVPPEQEPPIPEEEEAAEKEQLLEEKKLDSVELLKNGEEEIAEEEKRIGEIEKGVKKEEDEEKKIRAAAEKKEEEVEMDDWMFEFAQLFRTQVGIDADAHLDLHELGMELCAEALEETVTSEEAQELLAMAANKFQEVAALALFNWGNVYMCAARKKTPLEPGLLKPAFDWVLERYALAGEKYEAALGIKPDFYEGLLALGQQLFEMAKLRWSFATTAAGDEIGTLDPAEIMALFDAAEEKMAAASEMWERVEEERVATSQKEEALRKKRKTRLSVDGEGETMSAATAEEEAAAMRSQIHLFWGNMLFERSQVEFKLRKGDWKRNLDAALERFGLAGASKDDIDVVLKNHFSNAKDVAKEGESGDVK